MLLISPQRRTEQIDENIRLTFSTAFINRVHQGRDGESPEGWDRLILEELICEYVMCIEKGEDRSHHHGEACFEVRSRGGESEVCANSLVAICEYIHSSIYMFFHSPVCLPVCLSIHSSFCAFDSLCIVFVYTFYDLFFC